MTSDNDYAGYNDNPLSPEERGYWDGFHGFDGGAPYPAGSVEARAYDAAYAEGDADSFDEDCEDLGLDSEY